MLTVYKYAASILYITEIYTFKVSNWPIFTPLLILLSFFPMTIGFWLLRMFTTIIKLLNQFQFVVKSEINSKLYFYNTEVIDETKLEAYIE